MGKYSVGQTFTSKYGTAVIVEDKGLGKQTVMIRWLDDHGFEHTVKTSNLYNGKVLNPYAPVVRGLGFVGAGLYSPKTHKREHSVWSSMYMRSYDESYLEWKPSYSEATVDEHFYNFQNFAAWCQTQKGFFEPGYHLDKDLLSKGNKIYSPNFCRFVPAYVNTVLSASGTIRGEWPLGVHKLQNSRINPYGAQIKVAKGERKYLGIHPTPESAHKAWQIEKANQIELAVSKYAKERVFDTEIADALMLRAWNLRLDAVNGIETITL